MTTTQHIVSIGGGLTSTLFLPQLMVARYGRAACRFVMARLPNEDPDVWRLCAAVEAHLGITIEYIGLDKTPWDIFFEEGVLGNTLIDPCSRRLKREVLAAWMREHTDPTTSILHLGITHDEIERMIKVRAHWERQGWQVDAPLADGEFLTRAEQMAVCARLFGFVPRLYRYGFTHNNCGGACIKAGQREWARLLWHLPDVYAWWETNEAHFQAERGGTWTILRDRRGGTFHPLPLATFRGWCESWWAGCLPGLDFELLPRVQALDPTPACRFCEAA